MRCSNLKFIVETNAGKVQGYTKRDVNVFKGIPYAEPPVGDLRFSPPVPKEPWSGELDATKIGPAAIQGFSQLEEYFGLKVQESEADCLTLNIWTPAMDDAKRPVMFWIHGGAFIAGSGTFPLYYGYALAKRGDVVVVTINYRLGAFGYLFVPGVIANIGQLDQILALKWVRDNIETFGGDADNVTIFGESAGGMACMTLLGMPTAKGLFHRAIPQSGPLAFDPAAGERYSKQIFIELGLETGDIDALRKEPVEKITKAQNKINEKMKLTEILPFSPRIDPKTFPEHPLEVIKKGRGKDIELLIGTTRDEYKLFTVMAPQLRNLEEIGLFKIVRSVLRYFGKGEDRAKQLIKVYKDHREGLSTKPKDMLDAIATDLTFRMPAIRFADAYSAHETDTYHYVFTWTSPAFKGRLGACHGIELPFVFGTHKLFGMDVFAGKGAEVNALSENTMDSWITFARTGDPNHEGIPKWPSYNRETRSTMMIGREFKVVNAAFDMERTAWDGIL